MNFFPTQLSWAKKQKHRLKNIECGSYTLYMVTKTKLYAFFHHGASAGFPANCRRAYNKRPSRIVNRFSLWITFHWRRDPSPLLLDLNFATTMEYNTPVNPAKLGQPTPFMVSRVEPFCAKDPAKLGRANTKTRGGRQTLGKPARKLWGLVPASGLCIFAGSARSESSAAF